MKKNALQLFVIILLLASTLMATLQYGTGNAEAAEGAWTTKTDMPTPRDNLAAATVNGKIYAIGGSADHGFLSTVEMYDPNTDTWTTKTDMPTPRRFFVAVAVDEKIYAIGGYGSDTEGSIGRFSTVEMYDPNTDTWTTKTDMPTPRDNLAAATVNGKIYAIGGSADNGSISTVEMYDPNTDTWTTKTDMPTPRGRLAAATVNEKIYAIGGYGSIGGSFARFSTVQMYDPNTEFNTISRLIGSPILLLSALVFVVIIALAFSLVFKKKRNARNGASQYRDHSALSLPSEPPDYHPPTHPLPAPAPANVPMSTPPMTSTDLLKSSINLQVPIFIDSDKWSEIFVELKNTGDAVLNDVHVDLSDMGGMFEVDGAVAIPELRPGMHLKEIMRIRPKYQEGTFPVRIWVTGNNTTTEHEYTIKVGGTEVY